MEAGVSEIEINFSLPEQKPNNAPILRKSFDKNIQLNSEPNVDMVADEDKKKALVTFHQLLKRFHESPNDLLELPIIPLPKGERATASIKELEDDDVLRGLVNKDEYIDSNYDEWFRNLGFDPSFLYTKIEVENLLAMDNFGESLSTTMERYSYDDNFDPTQMTLKKALEIVRVYTVGEVYTEGIKNRAEKTMSALSPDLMPTKPIEVIFDPDQGPRGRYFALYRDKHYIVVSTSLRDNPYLHADSNFHDSTELDESAVMHEMAHAKQSEIFGDINLLTLNKSFDELVTVNDVNNNNEVYSKLNEAYSDEKNHDLTKNQQLVLSLFEGEAVLTQLVLCREKISHTADQNTLNSLHKLETNLVNRLRLRDEKGNKFSDCDLERLSIYRRGYDLIHPLQREFGLRNLIPILSSIDLPRLSAVQEGSSELQVILADPRLLPGLEKNPYIVQSLKQVPPHSPSTS